MTWPLTRRDLFHTAAAAGVLGVAASKPVSANVDAHSGMVRGKLTGAQAVAESLLAENVRCIFGIPGAQENELWDEFKARGLSYLHSAHEFGAATMADGYARISGKPGVLCVVPGPGVTNALTGLGEALLDSVPIVALVGDVAGGDKYRPFQVHSLDTVGLLKPVCKCVIAVTDVRQIPDAVRSAFRRAVSGEPGPVAVVIPFHLLIDAAEFHSHPPADIPLSFDDVAFAKAVALLSDPKRRIGIYAGMGCFDFTAELTAVAELLQAPVATSVSGKGSIPEQHPLAVGWGYGHHASEVAERAFRPDGNHPVATSVNTLLAIGVKFSEVSTGFYGNPQPDAVVHVDAEAGNLGKVLRTDVCVHADAGLFLRRLLSCADQLRRPKDVGLQTRIRRYKAEQDKELEAIAPGKCGHSPLALIAAFKRCLPADAAVFTDVTASEHWAAEYLRPCGPRRFFNPVDNQAMGWSLPAAIGAQRADPSRTIVTLTGDGCFLMAMQELSTAARDGLPVKCFVLDDRAYHYMQALQEAAYKRTTATLLPKLNYAALAQGFGVGYVDIPPDTNVAAGVSLALQHPGPILIRVATDYGDTPIRWIDAVRKRYAQGLSPAQKARFLARLASRSIRPGKDD